MHRKAKVPAGMSVPTLRRFPSLALCLMRSPALYTWGLRRSLSSGTSESTFWKPLSTLPVRDLEHSSLKASPSAIDRQSALFPVKDSVLWSRGLLVGQPAGPAPDILIPGLEQAWRTRLRSKFSGGTEAVGRGPHLEAIWDFFKGIYKISFPFLRKKSLTYRKIHLSYINSQLPWYTHTFRILLII